MQEANYSEWTRLQLWTLVEAACLLSGIEPLPPVQFDGNRKTGGIPAAIYADLKDAIDLKQIEFVKSRDGQIRGRRVKPGECIAWAMKRGYAVTDELLSLLNGAEDAADLAPLTPGATDAKNRGLLCAHATAASIKLHFAVFPDSNKNHDWWRDKMRDAKRNGLAECRVGEGKKHRGGSFWRPDLVAHWLVERHAKNRAGMSENAARAALTKFEGYAEIAEEQFPVD